jgi:hypothetical protein
MEELSAKHQAAAEKYQKARAIAQRLQCMAEEVEDDATS